MWLFDLLANGTTRRFQPDESLLDPSKSDPTLKKASSELAEVLGLLGQGGLPTAAIVQPATGLNVPTHLAAIRRALSRALKAHAVSFGLEQSVDQKRLAFLVGAVSFLLPVAVSKVADVTENCARDSISHFYFDPYAGPIFVGMLFFIGAFLMAYRGGSRGENTWSNIAGIGAILLAIFPTAGTGCDETAQSMSRVFVMVNNQTPPSISAQSGDDLLRLFDHSALLHAVGAATVFLFLGFYCWRPLRRIVPSIHQPDGELLRSKYWRNNLYGLCALVVFASCALLAANTVSEALRSAPLFSAWNHWNFTYYVEAAALWAFGLAWIVKARIVLFLNDPVQPKPS
ncbi:hypothetical protein NBRC116594_25930 [Shimia sp. NS0008-38b]|uniref:hypothetical protein n=1 Tax=Shimia sp. NS0008-38b TaxID=3127653 RepID=UPI00310466D3